MEVGEEEMPRYLADKQRDDDGLRGWKGGRATETSDSRAGGKGRTLGHKSERGDSGLGIGHAT